MISFWFWRFCYCLVCCVLCFVSSYIHSLENNIFEEGTKKETSLAVTTQRNRIFYWVLYNRSSHSILTPTRPKMSTHRQQQQEITSPWCVFNCALWVTGKKSIQWKKQEKTHWRFPFSVQFSMQHCSRCCVCLCLFFLFAFHLLLFLFYTSFECVALNRIKTQNAQAHSNIMFRFHLWVACFVVVSNIWNWIARLLKNGRVMLDQQQQIKTKVISLANAFVSMFEKSEQGFCVSNGHVEEVNKS